MLKNFKFNITFLIYILIIKEEKERERIQDDMENQVLRGKWRLIENAAYDLRPPPPPPFVPDPKQDFLYLNFHNDICERYGFVYYWNKSKYWGDLEEYIRSGYGRMEYANGDCYEGEFKDDMRHGEVRII